MSFRPAYWLGNNTPTISIPLESKSRITSAICLVYPHSGSAEPLADGLWKLHLSPDRGHDRIFDAWVVSIDDESVALKDQGDEESVFLQGLDVDGDQLTFEYIGIGGCALSLYDDYWSGSCQSSGGASERTLGVLLRRPEGAILTRDDSDVSDGENAGGVEREESADDAVADDASAVADAAVSEDMPGPENAEGLGEIAEAEGVEDNTTIETADEIDNIEEIIAETDDSENKGTPEE